MLQLLRENEIATRFRKAIKKYPKAVIAVPFWGRDAAATLGLNKGSPVRILCNLGHPGCNPKAIKEIHDLGIEIRTHPRLHAKIYATKHVAIVGSSNVSTNGMTVEGRASRGWIEANVCSDDSTLVCAVLALFETIWKDRETRRVQKKDIEAAIRLGRNWPMAAAESTERTLLAACRERPNDFRSIYVMTYTEGLDDNGKRLLRTIRSQAQPPKLGLTASDFRKAWGYQFDGIPEGAWLIDLDCRKSDSPRYVGCAKVTGLRLKVDKEADLTIAIPGVVRAPGSGARLRVSAEEKASLVSNAAHILKHSELVSLPDVIKIIDRNK